MKKVQTAVTVNSLYSKPMSTMENRPPEQIFATARERKNKF